MSIQRSASAWHHRPRSFLFWLLAVQLLAVLPLLAFAAWAVHQLGRNLQDNALAELERRVAVSADAVAREADRLATRLELLAAQPAAHAGDIQAMQRLAEELAANDDAIAGISALDREGRSVLATRRPAGLPLLRLPMRPEVAAVFAQETLAVGGLVAEAPGEPMRPGLAVPWRVDGQGIRYALGLSLEASELGRLLREQRWPETWTAALLDQHMLIVARSRDEARYFGKPATESLQRLVQGGVRATSHSRTKDGVEVVTAIAPVRGTPWWVAAGLPRQALAEEASRPFRQLVGGGILLTLLGISASVALGRYLDRQIKSAATGTASVASPVSEFSALGARQLMLNNELVGMVRLVDRRAVWHNPALELIFGYGPGELEGHSPRLMHLDDDSFTTFGARAYGAIAAGQRFRDQLQMVRKDGAHVWVDVSGVGLPDGSTLWMLLDVTAARLEHERVSALAFRDTLTGLPNRALFEDRFAERLQAARVSVQWLAVALVDLNGFKAVNDALGHAAGDVLLRVVAARLAACVRTGDLVARVGGDEFVLLLAEFSGPGEVDTVIERVRDSVSQPVRVGGADCHVTAAIGVAYHPRDGADGPALLALADARMYADKAASNVPR